MNKENRVREWLRRNLDFGLVVWEGHGFRDLVRCERDHLYIQRLEHVPGVKGDSWRTIQCYSTSSLALGYRSLYREWLSSLPSELPAPESYSVAVRSRFQLRTFRILEALRRSRRNWTAT